MLGVTGIAAAAGLAVGTLVIPSGAASSARTTHIAQLTAAQQTLYGLSAAAAGFDRPAGRYAVMTEKSIDIANGSGDDDEVGPKTDVIDTLTGGGVTYQDIKVRGDNGDPQPPAVLQAANGTSPTTRQLDAMPTSPAKLRAFLLAQAKQQLNAGLRLGGAAGEEGGQEDRDPASHGPAADGQRPGLRAGRRPALGARPEPGAARRRVQGARGHAGVQVKSGPPTAPAVPQSRSAAPTTVSKAKVETFENPKTGATLESAWLEPSGELLEDLYLSISYTNHIPANPYQG